MKILSMQNGSRFPFVDYIPVIQNFGSSKPADTTTTKSDKKENNLQKEIYDSIEYGLNIDFDILAEHAEDLLSDPFGGDLTPSVSKLLKLKTIALKVKDSKDLYDKAQTHIESESTTGEYAMTPNGEVYVIKEGDNKKGTVKLTTMDISKLDDSDDYLPLTNAQLLEVRKTGYFGNFAVDGSLAFNNSILNDVRNSVGISTVVENITTLISKFGKRDITQLPNASEAVARGMKFLYQVHTISSGAYKDVEVDDEMKKDITAAISYIYSGLGRNERNVLRLHAKMHGTTIGEYLQDLISMQTEFTYKEDLTNIPGSKGSGGSGDGSGDGSGKTDKEN
jgi:hypothetical protein